MHMKLNVEYLFWPVVGTDEEWLRNSVEAVSNVWVRSATSSISAVCGVELEIMYCHVSGVVRDQ